MKVLNFAQVSSSPLSLGNPFEELLELLLTHPFFDICAKIPRSLVNDTCASCPSFKSL